MFVTYTYAMRATRTIVAKAALTPDLRGYCVAPVPTANETAYYSGN